jgi:phosphoglycerate dehydrogenase-like enzyme
LEPNIELVDGRQSSTEVVSGCEAALVWTDPAPLRAALPGLRRLRWVHTVSAGIDNLLFPELVSSSVLLTNGTGVFDESVARYVMALMYAHAADLFQIRAAQWAHRWLPHRVKTLAGRHVLIVGFGGIGSATANLAAANGMIVHTLRRTRHEARPPVTRSYVTAELPEALATADYIVLALPLTRETRNLIDRRALAHLRPDAYLVNVGRGEVLDVDALRDALQHKQLAGAALDVVPTEPLPADDPLWDTPAVFVSPHMAADVAGWDIKAVGVWSTNWQLFCDGKELINLADKALGY